jgi:hypothetical protein
MLRSAERTWVSERLQETEMVLLAAMTLGVLAFVAYAYWRLFGDLDVSRAVVWGSLVFASFNVFRTALLVVDEAAAGAFV